MRFANEISELKHFRKFCLKTDGFLDVPTNNHLFFRAKQNELIERYEAARIFLNETDIDDWEHWFDAFDNAQYNKKSKNIYRSYFYEMALINYNIVVDLSWILVYSSIEYIIGDDEITRSDFSKILTLNDSINVIKKMEKLINNPDKMNSTLSFFKKKYYEYKVLVEKIEDFWLYFKDDKIRNMYNFIKHRGRPLYKEIESIGSIKVNIKQVFQDKDISPTVNIDDIRYRVSLEDCILELKIFDERHLYGYIETLISLLEKVLKPSNLI